MSRKEILDTMADCTMHFLEEECWMDLLSHEEWDEQYDYINEVVHELMGVLIKRAREEKK